MQPRAILFAAVMALTTVVLSLPLSVWAQEQAPLFGTWRVNLAASAFAAAPPYLRMTCTIQEWEDGLKVIYDIVGTRGGVTHWEWTGRLDGRDYALQGVEIVVTNAYSRIDDRTYTILVKEDGRNTTTSKVTISPDGRVMTVTSSTPNAQGQHSVNTVVYDRQ